MDLTMILTFVAAILVLIGFIYSIFHLFEKSKPSVEYIVLLAILIAIAVVGRLIGMSLPSIQLASFIIIVVGIVYGGETGFLVGMFTAVVSDLFMGIGYWTFFQMLAWGLMGYSAGLFSSKLENIGIRVVFGFLWGYLYGWHQWHYCRLFALCTGAADGGERIAGRARNDGRVCLGVIDRCDHFGRAGVQLLQFPDPEDV